MFMTIFVMMAHMFMDMKIHEWATVQTNLTYKTERSDIYKPIFTITMWHDDAENGNLLKPCDLTIASPEFRVSQAIHADDV